jgi:hypothetical protein
MKINENIAINETGFLFNPINGESYSVNPLGAEIIKLLKEGKDFDDIKDVIIQKYNVDENTFERDYSDFINILKQNNLIEG